MDPVEIKYKDDTVYLLPGEGAFRLYARKLGKSDVGLTKINEIMQGMNFDNFDMLIWCCIKNGSSKEGAKFTDTPEQVTEWLDENPYMVDEISEIINEGTPVAEEDSGNVKKAKG